VVEDLANNHGGMEIVCVGSCAVSSCSMTISLFRLSLCALGCGLDTRTIVRYGTEVGFASPGNIKTLQIFSCVVGRFVLDLAPCYSCCLFHYAVFTCTKAIRFTGFGRHTTPPCMAIML
jgi:hypothetical protein